MIKTIEAAVAWDSSSLFKSRITIVCGNCNKKWETKSTVTITNMNNRLADVCPGCNKWNVTKLSY